MKNKFSDKTSDILTVIDGGETPSLMEPLRIAEHSVHRPALLDLALELTSKSAGFKRSIPSAIQSSLVKTVRSMNCYYSNLIEGHNTHPIAIEQALSGNYSADHQKRQLQDEAKAHIAVQTWLEEGGVQQDFFSQKTMREIHRRFFAQLPDDLLWMETSDCKEKIIPGEWRKCNVFVGRHRPISPGALPRFLSRYESTYNALGKTDTLLALAAAHHRFLWIHPFLDGNGRVARLISHVAILNLCDTGGLWSIARGLARRVDEYKAHLLECDLSRRNDLDGRGNLSEEALVKFTRFFLEICIEQVNFMEKLMQPDHLRGRILSWAENENRLGHLPRQAIPILEALLYRGELSKNDVAHQLNVTERHARRLIAMLVEKGLLTTDSAKSPLKLVLPATLAEHWLPGLFPPS